MERGGDSGKRSRIDASVTPRSLKEKSDGVGRTVSSTGTKLDIQKKRSRMVLSDSESSDEAMKLQPRRSSVDSKTLGAKEKRDRAEHDRNGYVRKNNEASGSLMKTKKLDVFEFDEYDGFDSANLMRKRFDNGSVGVSGRSSFAPRKVDSSVGRSGSSRNGVFEKKRNTFVNGTGSMKSQEDSSSESDSAVPVKVKVNNKSSTLTESINHQDAETHERPPCSKKAQRRKDVVVKSTFRKSCNVDNDSESEESDMSRKSKRRKIVFTKPKKGINTKSKSTVPEPVKLDVREERRGRGGAGTEKQRLRERIKGMLTDAGWTIEYKPRRNQSYLDAVYVNPSGIAYWSIVKAYDALREQLKDEENDARPRKVTAAVASVSEDIVNKLARKAKKTRTEMTKKGKKNPTGSDSESGSDGEAHNDIPEERIRSSMQLGGKSTKKGRHGTDPDDLHKKSKKSLFYSNARPSPGSGSHYLHGRKSKKIERCTLLVRGPKDKKNPAFDGFNAYSEKRTLLSWLIESGAVQLRQKVQYMKRLGAKVMLEGRITREGIHCGCCSKILTVSRFEIHAGSKSCQPFQNIYLDSGTSLLQCQLKAWNMQKDATNLFHQVDTDGDDPNDDTCGICGDGGDLICCDSCPSTYHQSCLGLQVLPPGDWHCPNCTCKFCGEAGSGDGSLLSLLSCGMCERRYHQSCTSELEADKVQSFGSASSFCGPQCLELFVKLQKYLGVKNEIEGGYSWSLIRRVETDSDTKSQLSAQTIENNSKLAVGLAIMDECFLPIIDRRSGINLIRNALYNCGSNFSRIDYTGFYTAILEREDEIISAASLRFHGIQSAEMPFIGTRHIYRRQGMCRRLFDAIESAMRSLKVEKLVIPAIPDFLHTWTGNFGFTPLDDSVRKEMRHLNILAFPGIEMLQKLLFHGENIIADSAAGDAINSKIETEKKEDIPISVEKAMNTISKPEDDLPGEEGGISSSPCQIILKPDTKHVSGYICEDTGSSSCEGSLTDVNVQADTGLLFQEIQNASAKLQVENNLSGRVSSDLSSISQEAKG